MKKIFLTSISMAAGLLLCGLLVWHLDVRAQDWGRLVQGMSLPWVVVVAFLTFLLWWSGARKWAVLSLAWHGDSEPSPGFFLRHYAWQNWIGQFVPPVLAIIAGRSFASRQMPGTSFRSGAANAVYDQAVELILLSSFLPSAFFILHDHAPIQVWLPVAILGLAGACLLIFLVHRFYKKEMQPYLISVLGWSIFRVIVMTGRLVVVAPAFGLHVDLLSIAAGSPVVAVLSLIPLTPGNLGLAEWGWVGVLVYAGNQAVDSGLLVLSTRVLLLVIQSVLLLLVGVKMPLKGLSRNRFNKLGPG